MSDQTAPDYRKQLRHRVAFLTGLMAMREDLDSDIADLMNSMSSMTPARPQTGVRRGRPPKLITAASTITASAPEPDNGADRPRGGAGWNTEQRKRQSATMKERWAAFKAGKTPVPPNTAGSTVARTEIISQAITGRASKKSAARKNEAKKIYPKVYTPIIGFGTNAEFIYERGMANNGLIRIHEVKAAAATSINHKNLAAGSRLTVALAEMKRKSLIEHAGEKGEYRILPVAIRVRQQELRAREQEQKKAS